MSSTVDKKDLELHLITTLAPMLLAIAVFALSATAAIVDAPKTIVDELLSILAAICIFAAALLADSALDKLDMDAGRRFNFIGQGYLAFCIGVGIMMASVPILYDARKSGFSGFWGEPPLYCVWRSRHHCVLKYDVQQG